MGCPSCDKRVQDLAERLLNNHPKMSKDEAYSRAKSGFERARIREAKSHCLVHLWMDYFRTKKFSEAEAKQRTRKIIARLKLAMKTRRKELIEQGYCDPKKKRVCIPIFLLEKNDGVFLFWEKVPCKMQRLPLKCLLFRWSFKTDWKATFFWSFKHFRLIWIGIGYNPDYQLACVTGTCAGDSSGCGTGKCLSDIDCELTGCAVTGACGCPDPTVENSELTDNCSVLCRLGGAAACGTCVLKKCTAPNCIIASCAAGKCGFTCKKGFHYVSPLCVPNIQGGLNVPKALEIILGDEG